MKIGVFSYLLCAFLVSNAVGKYLENFNILMITKQASLWINQIKQQLLNFKRRSVNCLSL